MKLSVALPSRRHPWRAGIVVALLVGAGLVAAPTAHAAAPSTVTGGEVAWGYKQSFRSYVGNQTAAMPPTTALPAGERITLSGGAQFDSAGTPAVPGNSETLPYLFPATGGTVTDEDNLDISAAGIVDFHFPSHCFEAKVGDPRVVLTSGVATLRGHLEVTTSNSNPMLCASYDPPSSTGGADVEIGTANHTTVISDDGSSATVSLTGLALSAAGAAAMEGFATAGDVLDDLTFTVQLQAALPDAPSLAISKTDAIDPAGETITVTGTNIRAGFANLHGGGEAGVYAQIGYLDSIWRPSEGAASTARSNAYSIWVKEAAPSASYLAWSDNGDGTADFSWTVSIDKATLDAKARDGATLAVFTLGGGGVAQAVNELAVPIAFTGPTPTVPPVTDPSTTPIAAGSLTWGFKQSFRSYITGSIAKGSISTTGVGGSGGAFVFGQASGGSFDGATGTSNYSGSVRFQGHEGILDLRIADPVVRVDSAQSATLLLTVNGSRAVPFASLHLAAATRSTVNGAVSYSGVPATLTAQGANAFTYNGSQFYPAGTALDSLSFVMGSPSSAGGGTRTVAAFVAPPGLPSTPPATAGLALDPDSLESLQAGSEVTVTGEGFEAGETGIKVVIYSEPIVLEENLTADASGVATWTGSLPDGLTGEHTLTFQGSVARGIVLDIPASIVFAAVDGCPVTDAELTWGFKEAFRSYISGTIANGEWTTADGATYTTPDFSWTSGTGSYDGSSSEGLLGFTGSITFTGHGGILNTTVANPQLRFDDADTATLLLDVSGTTQAGDEVTAGGVEFATVDLSAGERALDGSTVSFLAAPAVLLAAGAEAFGTYETGEDLDPISVTFTTDADCTTIASEAPGNTPASASGTDLTWLWWLAGGILLLLVIAATIVLARRAPRS